MTEWKRNPGYEMTAVALVLVLQTWLLPVSAGSEPGSITGVVRSDDGRQPLAGAVVHVANRDGGKVHSSKPSGADGTFVVADLPPGTYEIGVESGGGLFLVYVPVSVAGEKPQQVELVVTASDEARELVGAGRKAGSAGVWSNPLTAALIIVGGAIVIGAGINAADDDEGQVTSF
jgi:hypothetical protein